MSVCLFFKNIDKNIIQRIAFRKASSV